MEQKGIENASLNFKWLSASSMVRKVDRLRMFIITFEHSIKRYLYLEIEKEREFI
jgi:hypothetical protein